MALVDAALDGLRCRMSLATPNMTKAHEYLFHINVLAARILDVLRSCNVGSVVREMLRKALVGALEAIGQNPASF